MDTGVSWTMIVTNKGKKGVPFSMLMNKVMDVAVSWHERNQVHSNDSKGKSMTPLNHMMGVDIWRMVRCVISEMCDFCISSIAPFLIYICPLYLDFFISFFENFLPKIYICLLYLDFFIPFCTWIFLCRFFIPFVPGFSNSIFHVICTYTLPSTHVHTTMYHTHILYT